MALVGRLKDLQLTELFHVLSFFKKSGKLTLSHGDDIGTVLFNNGKILHAQPIAYCLGPTITRGGAHR